MNKRQCMDFLELLNEIISDIEGTWQERKRTLLSYADETDKTNLAEFASWGWEE